MQIRMERAERSRCGGARKHKSGKAAGETQARQDGSQTGKAPPLDVHCGLGQSAAAVPRRPSLSLQGSPSPSPGSAAASVRRPLLLSSSTVLFQKFFSSSLARLTFSRHSTNSISHLLRILELRTSRPPAPLRRNCRVFTFGFFCYLRVWVVLPPGYPCACPFLAISGLHL